MRDRLIELINYARDSRTGQELGERIADHLIANGVTVQKWISVEDRLPEIGTGKVLVVKNYRGKPYVDIGEIIGGMACCATDEFAIHISEHKLTHWMPLPPAPKGE